MLKVILPIMFISSVVMAQNKHIDEVRAKSKLRAQEIVAKAKARVAKAEADEKSRLKKKK